MTRRIVPAFGVLGCALCGLGLLLDPARVGAAWLAALAFWIGLPLAALALLMLHDLVGGGWGMLLRGPLEAAAATLPLLTLLFLPILAALGAIYPWADAPAAGLYLAPPFFIARTAVYFMIWNGLAFLLLRRGPMPRASAPGLLLLAFSASFAAIDWLMSLEAPWTSSAYGLLVVAGWMLTGLAAVAPAASGALLPEATRPRRDLANLLLTALLFAAYIAFMQYLIIWEENLTAEIPWYLRRQTPAWTAVAALAILLQFVLPFFLLLSRRIKSSRTGLAAICGMVLAGRLLANWWLVLPAFPQRGFDWLDPAALIGVGGLALWIFLIRLDAAPARRNGPRRAKAAHG